MPFKSSTGQSVNKLIEVYRSDRSILGQSVGGGGGGGAASPGIIQITASGGTEATVQAPNGKWFKTHVFTTPGPSPFNVTSVGSTTATIYAELVGSGGPGGPVWNECAGGYAGGAGGFGIFVDYPITVQNYTVTVGGGGGANTTVSDGTRVITAEGGGAGGNQVSPAPRAVGGLSVSGPGNTASVVGGATGVGADAWSRYNPSFLLYPTPFFPASKGNGGGGGACPPGNGGPGNAGAARIYYQVPAPG